MNSPKRLKTSVCPLTIRARLGWRDLGLEARELSLELGLHRLLDCLLFRPSGFDFRFRAWDLEVLGFEFMAEGSGGLGFRGLGSRVEGLRVYGWRVEGPGSEKFGFRVFSFGDQVVGFRVQGARVLGFGFRIERAGVLGVEVSGFWCRLFSGCRVQGFRFRVQILPAKECV